MGSEKWEIFSCQCPGKAEMQATEKGCGKESAPFLISTSILSAWRGYTATFGGFIFVGHAMTYGEKRENVGLTRFLKNRGFAPARSTTSTTWGRRGIRGKARDAGDSRAGGECGWQRPGREAGYDDAGFALASGTCAAAAITLRRSEIARLHFARMDDQFL